MLKQSDKKLAFFQLFNQRYRDTRALPITLNDIIQFLKENLFEEFEPLFLKDFLFKEEDLIAFLVRQF